MDIATIMEIDELLQTGYKLLEKGEDIQEILDLLHDKYYWDLDSQRKRAYLQLWDLANKL
jgi:hypothetical protein